MIVTPIASPARILFVAYEMWTGVAMLKYSINNVMVPPIKHMEGSTLSDVLTLYINCQYWDQDDSAQIISFEDDINDNLV